MARTTILAAGLALATVLGGVSAASAEVYAFSFVADTGDATDADYGSLVITGDLFTAGSTLPAALTNITGVRDERWGTSGVASGAITGLSTYASADNVLYETGAAGRRVSAAFPSSRVGRP